MPRKKKAPPEAPKTLIEVMILQARDGSIHRRMRGAPTLKRHASPTFLGKLINDVTHEAFRAELNRYREGRPEHQNGNRMREEFNQLMHWAKRKGYRTAPYRCFGSPIRKSMAEVMLTQPQVEAFLLETDKTYHADFTVRIAMRALVLLGLRLAEVVKFSLDRVDPEQWVYHQVDLFGHFRIIPISGPMRVLIRHALRQREGLDSFQGVWIDQIRLQRTVRVLGEQVGIPGLMPSMLTRTAIRGRILSE